MRKYIRNFVQLVHRKRFLQYFLFVHFLMRCGFVMPVTKRSLKHLAKKSILLNFSKQPSLKELGKTSFIKCH